MYDTQLDGPLRAIRNVCTDIATSCAGWRGQASYQGFPAHSCAARARTLPVWHPGAPLADGRSCLRLKGVCRVSVAPFCHGQHVMLPCPVRAPRSHAGAHQSGLSCITWLRGLLGAFLGLICDQRASTVA